MPTSKRVPRETTDEYMDRVYGDSIRLRSPPSPPSPAEQSELSNPYFDSSPEESMGEYTYLNMFGEERSEGGSGEDGNHQNANENDDEQVQDQNGELEGDDAPPANGTFLTTEPVTTNRAISSQVFAHLPSDAVAGGAQVYTIPLKPSVPKMPKILAALRNKTKDRLKIPDSLARAKNNKLRREAISAIEKGQGYTDDWSRCALELEQRGTDITNACKGALDDAWKTMKAQQNVIDKQVKQLNANNTKITTQETLIINLKSEVAKLKKKKTTLSSHVSSLHRETKRLKEDKNNVELKLLKGVSNSKTSGKMTSDEIIEHEKKKMDLKLHFIQSKEEQKQKTEEKKQEQKLKTRKDMQSIFAGSFGGLAKTNNTVRTSLLFIYLEVSTN